MIIVAFVWISQVVILRLHDVIPITRVISRRVSIARSVQYHILRDDHAYFHDITQEHFPRGDYAMACGLLASRATGCDDGAYDGLPWHFGAGGFALCKCTSQTAGVSCSC